MNCGNTNGYTIEEVVDFAISNERESGKRDGWELIGAWDAAELYAQPEGYTEKQFRDSMLAQYPGFDPTCR